MRAALSPDGFPLPMIARKKLDVSGSSRNDEIFDGEDFKKAQTCFSMNRWEIRYIPVCCSNRKVYGMIVSWTSRIGDDEKGRPISTPTKDASANR